MESGGRLDLRQLTVLPVPFLKTSMGDSGVESVDDRITSQSRYSVILQRDHRHVAATFLELNLNDGKTISDIIQTKYGTIARREYQLSMCSYY